MGTVVIYIGGEGPAENPVIPDEVVAVLAADSGLELADAHGMNVDLVVGDMDSVNPVLLQKYAESGTKIEQFPHDKDVTDFELALSAASRWNAEKLIIIGGGGHRVDHLLGNFAIAVGPQTLPWEVDMLMQTEHIYICRPLQPRMFEMKFDDTISLIPIGADAIGVTTTGLKWELKDSTLDVHAARGISNICVKENVVVEIGSGALAIIRMNGETDL